MKTFQDQFRTWQKDFTLNVEEESKLCYSFSLTDGEGGEILKYPTDGCKKGEFGENALKYMFVSTGWGAQVNILTPRKTRVPFRDVPIFTAFFAHSRYSKMFVQKWLLS